MEQAVSCVLGQSSSSFRALRSLVFCRQVDLWPNFPGREFQIETRRHRDTVHGKFRAEHQRLTILSLHGTVGPLVAVSGPSL